MLCSFFKENKTDPDRSGDCDFCGCPAQSHQLLGIVDGGLLIDASHIPCHEKIYAWASKPSRRDMGTSTMCSGCDNQTSVGSSDSTGEVHRYTTPRLPPNAGPDFARVAPSISGLTTLYCASNERTPASEAQDAADRKRQKTH